jgi:TolA-binding protein
VDCEKFDRIVLDLLYDELDELTSAAAKRHMEHCMRCRGIGSGLRATREVGMLPLVEAPEGLELRILDAERHATELLPLGKRIGRGLSLLAGYAMRPQLAMAALLMLMIGSSLLFLRAQPGDREHVLVTERGVPESDNDSVAVMPKKVDSLASESARTARPSQRADDPAPRRERSAAEAKPEARAQAAAPEVAPPPAPAAALGGAVAPGFASAPADDKLDDTASEAPGDTDASYNAAMAAYRDGRYSEAQRRFAAIASQGGAHAANAALYEVQALRMVSGCPSAAPRFEDVHSHYPGAVGNDAAWQAADCFRSLGELGRARQDYEDLLSDPNYKARAQDALAELDQRANDQEIAARKAAPAKAKAGAPPAAAAPPPAAAKPSAPSP